MRRVLFLGFLVFVLMAAGGCGYTLRYKYPAPVPSKEFYEINRIKIFIIGSEEKFQELVKQKFGENDDECMAFTDYKGEDTLIYFKVIPGAGVEMEFLGHEIWYHYLEKQKGH